MSIKWKSLRGRLGVAVAAGVAASGTAALVATMTVAAATFTVDTTSDSHASAGATTCPSPCSLRAAIEAANNLGGSVTINVPSGTFSLSLGELQVGTFPSGQTSYNITIQGAGSGSTIVNQTDGVNRVFDLDPNLHGSVTTVLDGVTISGGHDAHDNFGGAGVISGFPAGGISGSTAQLADNTTLSNCILTNNHVTNTTATTHWGGGIQNIGGNLTVTNCTVSNNSSGDSLGGGLYYDSHSPSSGTLTVTGSTFSGNTISSTSPVFIGGAGMYIGGTASSHLVVTSSTFTGNSVTGNNGPVGGGGIFSAAGDLQVTRSTFTNNTASGPAGTDNGGGAIDVGAAGDSASNFFVHLNRIVGNHATNGPTGVYSVVTADYTNNWWGCNAGPGNTGCDSASGSINGTPTTDPRLVLTPTASPSTIKTDPTITPHPTSTITGSLKINSSGTDTSSGGTIPNGTTMSFATGSLGGNSVSPSSATLSSGTASSTYTAGPHGGAELVPVTFDNQTSNASLTVDEPPSITSANSATFLVGASVSCSGTLSNCFHVTATGYPAPTFSETGALPSGVTLNSNGTLSGTPAACTGGVYPISITASNGITADNGSTTSPTQNFTLTVNEAPSITSANNTTFTTGQAGTFTVTACGYPAPTVTLTSGSLPSGVTYNSSTHVLSGTPASGTGGQYALQFTGHNTSGSDAVQSFTLTIDEPASITSGSSTTFTVGTAGSFSVTTGGFPHPTLSDGSAILPGGVTFVNNGDGTATLSGTPTAGSGGTYSFTITAHNGIGTDATQAFTLTVDEAASVTSANHTTFTTGVAGSFNVTTLGFPKPGLSETGALPSGVTFTDNGNGTATLAGTPAAGTGGSYPITITAHNGIGTDGTQSFTLTVDQPPAITSADHTTFTVGQAGNFSVTTTGNPHPALSDGSATLPTGVTFHDNGDGTATLAGTPAAGTGGTYAFTITASNGVTPNATQSFTLTVDEAPTVTSANHTTFTVGTPGTFTVTTSGFPNGASMSIGETGALPSGVTFTDNGDGTATLAGTPAAGTGGTYSLTISANNGVAPAGTQSFTLTVDQAPAITSADNTTFTVGTPGTFTVTTSGFPTGASMSITESGTLPSGVTFTDNHDGTATLAGTPGNSTAGDYPISIGASNGVSPDASQNFTLHVLGTPHITSANHTTFVVGQAGTFTVTTTGSQPMTISDGGATLPGGVTFVDNGDGTATLSGTPAAGSAGTYSFTITASNGVPPDATQAFTLQVNEAPAITSADHTTFTAGTAGTFTVTTTGTPTASVSDGGASLPSGVSFVDNGDGTATLSGTPAAGTGGTYSFTITAHNGVGSDATQSFTLTVDEAPSITSADHTTFTAGSAGTFTVQTAGFPAPSLSETGSLPSGVSFVDNGDGTATLSGTPAAGTGGSYPLSITASNGIGSDATQSFTLVVDEAPTITSADHTTFTVGSAGSFTVTTTGFPPASLSENGATLPNGVTFVDNGDGTATFSGTPAPGSGGVYSYTITAHNSTPPDATQGFTLTVNEAPSFTSADHTTFTVGSAGTFTVTTLGFPEPSLNETGALPSGISFVDNGDGTATLSGTPAAGTGGVYTLSLTAHNGIGSDATQSFTLTVDEALSITSVDHTTLTVGTAGSFSVTTRGFPTPSLSDGGASLPSGVTFVDNGNGTATLSGTPAAGTGGVYHFTITAHNGQSADATQSFTLTVDEAASVTSASSTTFTVGSAGSFTVTTNGFPTPSVGESGALPSGVGFVDNGSGTGTLSGTPAAGTGGVYHLTFTAHNGIGADGTQSFTLTVNQAAAITSASSTTFVAGSSNSFSVTTTGFPVPSIGETGSLPSGVSFVDNGNGTGTLSGTPAAGTGGVYHISFTAHNGVGSDATQSFTLTVNEAAAITSANTTTFQVNTAGSFTVTTRGFPVPSLSESGSLPSGVTFVDNGNGTATLSGTPAAGTQGSYPLTLTAHNGVGSDGTQAFTLIVGAAPTTTTVTASTTTPTFGQAVTFTATVAPVSPSTGTPQGTVTFSVDGTNTVTVTLVAGQAHWTTSSLQQGVHTVGAHYNGQTNTFQPSSGSINVTVGCATTYTGRIAGTLTISSGSACINAARISGGVSISGGASVSILNSTIGNGLTSNGAKLLSVCLTSVGGSVSVSNSTGFVLIGSNGDDTAMPCASNTIGGGVTLTGNSGGLELGGTTSIKGAVTVTNNVLSGPAVDAENGAPEIEHNFIKGSLSCSGNSPAPTNDGAPNTVSGSRSGQCGAAGF